MEWQMSIDQGFHALASRRLDDAQIAFTSALRNNELDVMALIGMARLSLLRGRTQDANDFLARAEQRGQGPLLQVTRAQIVGQQGRRAEATALLQQVIAGNPHDALALAVLAEQRLRQGYWDEGANFAVKAIMRDRDGQALAHVCEITYDMSEAVAQNKIPAREALKFINKIDYGTGNETSSFFAQARRAFSSGEVLRQQPRPAAPRPPAPAQATSAPRPVSQPAQRQQTPPQQAQRPRPVSRPASGVTHTTTSLQSQRDQQRASNQRMQPDRSHERGLGALRGHQPDFLLSIRKERELNEELQRSLGSMYLAEWPSDHDTSIDTIAMPESSQASVTEQLASYRQLDFRVTDGSILSQIYMDRCMSLMLNLIPTQLVGTVVLHPHELAQLELNVIDGLLEEYPEVFTGDLGELTLTDPKTTALAKFIGEAIIRAYGGTWEYHEPPSESQIHFGRETISPYKTALEWMGAQNPYDVNTNDLVEYAAELSSQANQLVASSYQHIDLLDGLRGDLLRNKLAELFSFYRIALARVPSTEIAPALEVLSNTEKLIVFELPEEWCPTMPTSMLARAKRMRSNKYAIGYRRVTGEFVMMGGRAGFVRCLPDLAEGLDPSTKQAIVEALAQYHIPGAMVLSTEQSAQRIAQVTQNSSVTGPRLQKLRDGSTELVIWEVYQKQPRAWVIKHSPEGTPSWSMFPR